MNSARVPSHMQRLATFGDGSNSKGSGRKRYQDIEDDSVYTETICETDEQEDSD